jgi:microsomal epoxide hydrolase
MSKFEQDRFVVSIPQNTIDDLKSRLRETRWPTDIDEKDDYYGTSQPYMKDLVRYWLEEFDWREAEKKLNEWDNRRVSINGSPIHFIRQEGSGPSPIPLIMSHGWPWSYREWTKVIGPLAGPAAYGGDPADAFDAFDVIVPSLVGFAFSNPANRPDMNFWKMAELWHKLMTEYFGYRKYAAAGADYGALVTGQLGHKYADELYGIWLSHRIHLDMFQGDRGWDITGGALIPDGLPDALHREIVARQQLGASHVAVHILDNQNLAYGLADSPVGMLSWILRRWTKCACRTSELNCSYEVLVAGWPNSASMSGWLIPPKMASRTSGNGRSLSKTWRRTRTSSTCSDATWFTPPSRHPG